MRDVSLKGAVLLGNSLSQTLERNKNNPRWGDTEELQEIEAKAFFECEREKYRQEAEKYGFKLFEHNELASQYLKNLTLE